MKIIALCKMLNEKNFSIKKWWFEENNQYVLTGFRQKFVKDQTIFITMFVN